MNAYAWLTVGAIAVSAVMWGWVLPRERVRDVRLTIIYFVGLVGAFLGAKIAFLIAEGWFYRGDWLALASGRSITGGLLGGYAAIEIVKSRLGYRRSTGDLFAAVVPAAIAIGRVGCVIQGCCAGVACAAAWWSMVDAHGVYRWPSQWVELSFNVLFLAWVLMARWRGWAVENRFHVYLIAYGAFRFANEFLRERREWIGPIGGYHVIAAGMVVLGVIRYCQRLRELRIANCE